jgi:WD40 repeat protein
MNLLDPGGPVQVWDTRTGAEIASYFKKDQTLLMPAFSKDGRYFATHNPKLDNHCLVLLDIIAGTSRELPLPDECGSVLDFSPSGDLLARWLFGDDDAKELQIFDTSNGRLLDKRESLGFEQGEVFTDKALLHEVPTKTKVTNVEIWSRHDRKAVAKLENAGPNSAQSLDGRFYVAERLSPDGQSIGKWAVWNLCSHRIEAEFQSEISAASLPVLTENGRWLAASCKGKLGSYVELRETHTGKQLATIPVKHGCTMTFAPDGRFLALHVMEEKEWMLIVLEVPAMKILWKQPWTSECEEIGFSRDSRTVFAMPIDSPELKCYDCKTGKLRRRVALSVDCDKVEPKLHMTPDRGSLLVHQIDDGLAPNETAIWIRWLTWIPWLNWQPEFKNDIVLVLHTDTCSERIRLRGWNTSSVLLSDDGRTLLTVHDEGDDRRVLRCWDVEAWKPLHWAIGVPAGLGALAFVLFTLWRRWRSAMVKNAAGG